MPMYVINVKNQSIPSCKLYFQHEIELSDDFLHLHHCIVLVASKV